MSVCLSVLPQVYSASSLQRGPESSVGSSSHPITEHLPSDFFSSFFRDPRYQSLCSTKRRVLRLEARAELDLCGCQHATPISSSSPQLGLVSPALLDGVSGPARPVPFCSAELGRVAPGAISAVEL